MRKLDARPIHALSSSPCVRSVVVSWDRLIDIEAQVQATTRGIGKQSPHELIEGWRKLHAVMQECEGVHMVNANVSCLPRNNRLATNCSKGSVVIRYTMDLLLADLATPSYRNTTATAKVCKCSDQRVSSSMRVHICNRLKSVMRPHLCKGSPLRNHQGVRRSPSRNGYRKQLGNNKRRPALWMREPCNQGNTETVAKSIPSSNARLGVARLI